jgi:glycerophosphoryl diester phosphodiesterase
MIRRLRSVSRKWKRVFLSVAAFCVLFLFFNNTSLFSSRKPGTPTVLVHRGVSQVYTVPDRLDNCAAAQMLPPEHDYLENTIRSMQAAFDQGADVVEFDVHATVDGQFAVFHDRFLQCRTNGQGLTREHVMADLKALDIGYGYTADGGKTYPFRGKAVGMMPSMSEVLETFPDRSFLIDIKGGEPNDGVLLAEHLSKLPADRRSRLMAFGRDSVLEKLRQGVPDLRMFSASSTAGCLLRYIAYGWTGIVPESCHNAPVWVPINVAPWLWGWPDRFMNRFESHGSYVIAMGPYPADEISPGLDTQEDLSRLPANYTGGIWMNMPKAAVVIVRPTSQKR